MSKELEPIEALCYLDDIAHCRKMKYDPHELKLIIEDALKENCALKYLMRGVIYTFQKEDFTLEKLGKKLKALEIIKKHKLMNYVLKNKKCADMYHLTQEEINLLKEYFK